MRITQSSVTETVRRVRDFLDRNATLLGPVNQTGTRKALDDVDARLTANASDQARGRVAQRGETDKQRALRLALRANHLSPIATIARAKLRDIPNFAALRLPDPRLMGARLVAAANAMGAEAGLHVDVFVEAGLPADFVDRLQAAVNEVTASLGVRATGRGQQVRGTAGLAMEVKQARQVIRVLNTLVVPLIGRDDALLREWRSLSHIDRKKGPVARNEVVPIPAPVPAPAPQPVVSAAA